MNASHSINLYVPSSQLAVEGAEIPGEGAASPLEAAPSLVDGSEETANILFDHTESVTVVEIVDSFIPPPIRIAAN